MGIGDFFWLESKRPPSYPFGLNGGLFNKEPALRKGRHGNDMNRIGNVHMHISGYWTLADY